MLTIEEQITYGNLMSMKTKYLMRCYRHTLRDGLEMSRYRKDGGACIEVDYFDDGSFEGEDYGQQYSKTLERSSIVDTIMEAM